MKKFNINRIYVLFNSSNFKILFIIIVLLFIFSSLILVIESSNENINNFFDAFWYIFISFTTVGYGDITPNNIMGRIIGLFAIGSGVALVALITGQLASILVEAQLKKGRGLMKLRKISNHIIICGWKTDFIGFLKDLLKSNPDVTPEDVVLVNNETPEIMQTVLAENELMKVNYIHGEYFDENILLRAQISTAKKIIILADDTGRYSPSEIDSKTVMTVLTIESINKATYICAELFDSKFTKYLKRSHCDEIILTKDFSKKLVVNSISGNGFANIIEEIINPEKGAKMVTQDINKEFIGKTYDQLFDFFKQKDQLLIGIVENTGNFFLRKTEAIKEAQKTPDISKLVENLKGIKKMRANEPIINPKNDYIVKPNSSAIIILRKVEEVVHE